MDRRQSIGRAGEQLALQYLKGLGLKVLARNYRCKLGELDLVLMDKNQVVFVEVRTKTSDSYGSGLESITSKKQQKIRAVAQYFLADNHLLDASVRFDVVSIFNPPAGPVKLEYVKGAF